MIPSRLKKLSPAGFSGALTAVFVLATSASVLAQVPTDQISPSAIREMSRLIQVKHAMGVAEQKISSNIGLASRQARFLPIGGADATIDRTNIDDSDSTATVKITAPVVASVLNRITGNGGTILETYPEQNTIMAKVPLVALAEIAKGNRVIHIDEPDVRATNVGAVTSQGYVSHKAKNVVEGLNITGSGVSVGVLSDSASATRVAALIASGDLPANTIVLSGQAGSGNDEGTAMMEIIHDLAPGAQLFFATAFNGVASFAANITALGAAGCKVIVDDVSYFNEGVFQDGPIAQAVNSFVAGGGIYFSSAANSGNLDSGTAGCWEGDFSSGGSVTTPISDGTNALVHNFNASGTPALYDTLTAATNYVTLKWSDPLGASNNDYDLFVLNSAGTTVLGSSVTRQTGSSDPYEIVSNTTTAFPVGSRIVIVQYNNGAAPSATRALHLDTNRGSLSIATGGSVYGHNGGASTQSLAATFWNSAKRGVTPFTGAANPVELFSSDGPRKIFYTPTGAPIGSASPTFASGAGQTLLKPDFTAADGVTCKTPGFSPFFGTSAAAPHAAAIGALMISAKPTITNTQIHNIFVSTALDNGIPGFDRDGGYGVLDALSAVNAARALP